MANDVDDLIHRSDRWSAEMAALRTILLACGLEEAVKWRKPCYGHDGANVAIMQEMKGFLALMFFKGVLLDDTDGLLHDQGPNSRSARRMQFTAVAEIDRQRRAIERLVAQAIEVERAGMTVEPAPELELVAELRERLDGDPRLLAAFASLTPGRQREYHLHVSGAKQASTRESRVDTIVPRILAGRGLRDR